MRGDELYSAVETTIDRFERSRTMLKTEAYTDGGADMLFPRLRRAALNQCGSGSSTLSRYAIWANTVRDHIDEALRLADRGNKAEAERLLLLAHNSLSAFSEIQKFFEYHLSRYIVKLDPKDTWVQPASSMSISPEDIDGRTLIAVAAENERDALQMAKESLGERWKLIRVELAGALYLTWPEYRAFNP